IELPGEAVEWATELGDTPIVVAEPAPAMHAHIAERLYDIRRRSHDNYRDPANLVDVRVADFGNLLFPAGPLPGLFPDLFDFHSMVVGARIFGYRHRVRPRHVRPLISQKLWRRRLVPREFFLVELSRRRRSPFGAAHSSFLSSRSRPAFQPAPWSF